MPLEDLTDFFLFPVVVSQPGFLVGDRDLNYTLPCLRLFLQ